MEKPSDDLIRIAACAIDDNQNLAFRYKNGNIELGLVNNDGSFNQEFDYAKHVPEGTDPIKAMEKESLLFGEPYSKCFSLFINNRMVRKGKY